MVPTELKRAFMWGVGLGVGFAAAGMLLGVFKKL